MRLLVSPVACALLLTVVASPAFGQESANSPLLPDRGNTEWRGKNPFEVWQKEHRWVRLGFRFYGYSPTIQPHAALKLGPGLGVPLTTDFFMGVGMRIAFLGAYNLGDECVNRGGVEANQSDCPDGHRGGVDYTWREPISAISPNDPGADGAAVPGSDDLPPQRRKTHVGSFALLIGANYEVTIPNLALFRIWQPFVGGGLALFWVHNWSDMTEHEFVLINNAENDAYDSGNVDPWSKQGPLAGGDISGGFHLNVTRGLRFTVEVGYTSVQVPEFELQKATEGFHARHMDYTLGLLRFGGGVEGRF